MNKVVCRLLAFVLVLLAATPARAERTAFRLEDLEVLPVHDLEWGVLLLEHPQLVVRVQLLAERAKKLATHLAARDDAEDAGSRQLKRSLAQLAEQMKPSMAALREALRPLGVTDAVWDVVHDAPRGRMRVERHAMRLALDAPGVAPDVRTLHQRLIATTEGALLGLDHLRGRMPKDDAAARAAIDASMQEIRIRFWRVMDATLDRSQRTYLRRRLPNEIAKPADLLGHVFLLPGLTPTQMTRLKALLVQLEAESAPDTATIQRVNARLAVPDLAAAERSRLEREKRAAERGSIQRAVRIWRDGLALLDAEQAAELLALPPFLSAQARVGELETDLKRIAWHPDQEARLKAFIRRHAGIKGRMVQQLGVAEIKARAAGPDGPQQDAVEMTRYRAYADALTAARIAVHELFTDLLDDEQVIRWVLGD